MSVVVISAADVAENHSGRVPGSARAYANRKFTTSEQIVVGQGSKQKPSFYQDLDVSQEGDNVRIHSGELYSTVDSSDPLVGYTIVIYDTKGRELCTPFTQLRIPAAPTPTTWNALRLYSAARALKDAPTWLTTNELFALLNGMDLAPDASDVIKGKVKLTQLPAVLWDPIAIGANDPLWAGFRKSYWLADYGHDFSGVTDFLAEVGSVTPVEVVITEDLAAGAHSYTFSENVLVQFQGLGRITVPSGRIVTINALGPLAARQYFFGEGVVWLGKNATARVHLSWWAGMESNGADDTHAFEQMLASLAQSGSGAGYGGGIGEIGRGIWRTDAMIIPAFTRLIGQGNDPDGVDGTTIIPTGTPSAYLFSADGRARMSGLEHLTVSSENFASTHCFFLESSADSGFHLSFKNVGFKGASAGGANLTHFGRIDPDSYELIGVVFDHCWWQVPENSVGFYLHTQNSSFNFISPTFQCLSGATGMKLREAGWITVSNPDARGQGGAYDYPLDPTPQRFDLTASVTASYLNSTWSKITLDAGTLEANRFYPNDLGRQVTFTSGATFTAYIIDIEDAFNAILSYHPVVSGVPATISNKLCKVQSYLGHTNIAYAVIDSHGPLAGLTVEGGADEGFNYSLRLGQAAVYGGATYNDYTFQGRVAFTDACRFTSRNCKYGWGAIEDLTTGPEVVCNFIDDYVGVVSARGPQIVGREGLLFGYYPNGQDYGVPNTRVQQMSVLQERYSDDLATISHRGVRNIFQKQIQMWDSWDTGPVAAVADTRRRQNIGDTQMPLSRWGIWDTISRAWVYFYDLCRNDYNGHLQLSGNHTGFKAFELVDMPLIADGVEAVTIDASGAITGATAAIDGTTTVGAAEAFKASITPSSGDDGEILLGNLGAGRVVRIRENNGVGVGISQIDIEASFLALVGSLTINGSSVLTALNQLTKYLTVAFTKNTSATLSNTPIVVTVAAATKYQIELTVFSTAVAARLQMAFGGTSTQTSFIGQWTAYTAADGARDAGAQITAAGTAFTGTAALDTVAAYYTFKGAMLTNAAGTFLLQGAQQASNASNTVILPNSSMILTKLS